MNEAADTIVETRAKCNDLPDADYLKECFECDPETGVLIWKRRPAWHFSCSRVASIWNAKYAGREAGSGWHRRGYRLVGITGYARYYCHRVVWAIFNGRIPQGMSIDHINGVTSDNRLANLRLATHSQNMLHSKRKVSKLYIKGLPVGVSPSLSKWMVRFQNRYLGTFETIELASQAYQQAYLQAAGEFAHEEVAGQEPPNQPQRS